MKAATALLADAAAFTRFLLRHLIEDRCQQSAASLAWVSLFALVPLFTVFYSVLSMVPALEAAGPRFEDFLFRHFVPATGAQLQTHLHGFAEQARELTPLGSLMLFGSAWLLLGNIETTLGRIWRTPRQRHGALSIAVHWAILSLGPLLAGAAMLLSAYLYSLALMDVPTRALSAVVFVLPTLLTCAAVTLTFLVVPACHVPFLHALAGGALTTLAFDLARGLFGWAVAHSSYSLVYGAFAVVPLFLLWLYLCWLLLLLGAEFVHALGGWRGENADSVTTSHGAE